LAIVRKRTFAPEWLSWQDDRPPCANAALAVRTACASKILRLQSNGPEIVSTLFLRDDHVELKALPAAHGKKHPRDKDC
jgi:hypothetical protein